MPRIVTVLITLAAAAAFALGLGASTSLATVPPVPWAAQVSSSDGNFGYSVSPLPDGSSIVTGAFSGTATFGSTTLTSAGGDDIFVAKLDRSGSYVWATRAGGSVSDAGYGVSALPDGSSIVTGYFRGPATFGSTTLTSGGNRDDIFVAKLSPSGAFEWAKYVGQAESAKQSFGYGVSALPDGSAIVAGYFEGTATFGSTTLTTTRGDGFVAKVDPDGSFAWAKQINSASGYVYGISPSVLTDGSVIVTGCFGGTTAFGSISLTSAGSWDNFITKLDSSGSFVWASRAGGTSNASFCGTSVSALPDGSAIYTGRFNGTATFGSTTLTSAGDIDVFVAKVDPSGAYVWATRAGGSGSDAGYAVSAQPDGSSIVTGWFSGTATFGSTTLTSAAGSADVFVAKVDPSGAYVWATQAGASGFDAGFGVSAQPDGSVFVTGQFIGSATFGSTTLTTSAPYGGYVATFLDAPQAPVAPQAVAGDGQATVTITPLAGGAVTTYTVLAGPGGKTCTITAPATSCIVTGLTNGTRYTFTATATNATGTSPASPASNGVTPSAPAATSTTLGATVLPSRTRITSGQSMRLGIRTTNTGAATAASVASCITLPANLVVIRTGGATRSGRTLCFSLGDLPAGATRTNVLTVRAVATRSVIRRVSATTRSTSASPAPTTARSAPIRISPRAARARVTG